MTINIYCFIGFLTTLSFNIALIIFYISLIKDYIKDKEVSGLVVSFVILGFILGIFIINLILLVDSFTF